MNCAERRQKPRHADRKAGRRNRLAAKARDQPVVTPAAADRAEADRAAGLILDLESEFGLKHRAGVVLEAAHHGGVDADAVFAIASSGSEPCNLS